MAMMSVTPCALTSDAMASASRVPIHVDEPGGVGRKSVPVRTGIPFPRGALKDAAHVRLLDRSGKETPCQVRKVAAWPDGSVRWIHLDFFADVKANTPLWKHDWQNREPSRAQYMLECGPGVSRRARPRQPASVKRSSDGYVLDTGVIQVEFGRGPGGWIRKVRYKGTPVAANAKADRRSAFVDVRDKKDGQPDRSSAVIEKVEIEDNGPVQATVKLSGTYSYPSGVKARFVVRLQGYAGKGYLRVYHTFVYAHHPGKPGKGREVTFKDKKVTLPTAIPINQLSGVGLRLPLLFKPTRCALGGERTVSGRVGTETYLYQATYNSYQGGGPRAFKGKRAAGWGTFSDGRAAVTVFMRNFFREYPKEVLLKDGVVTAWVHPERAPLFDLSRPDTRPAKPQATGTAKTTEILFRFHDAGEDGERFAKGFEKPSLGYVTPQWYARTRAMGDYHPYDPAKFPLVEEGARSVYFLWIWNMHNDPAGWRGRGPWYGIFDYGDWQCWFKSISWQYERGRYGWVCNEPAIDHGLWFWFLRTGDRLYYDTAEAMSRHHMDVDTVHCGHLHGGKEIRREFIGGGRRHNVYHWGDKGVDIRHTWNAGEIDYYYYAGYRRALDVAKLMADYHSRHVDTNTKSLGATLWTIWAVWEATGEKKYEEEFLYRLDRLAAHQLPSGAFRYNASLRPDTVAKRDARGPHRGGLGMNYITPTLMRCYEMTGNQKAAKVLLGYARQFVAAGFHKDPKIRPYHYSWVRCLELMAFGYRYTGDRRYIDAGNYFLGGIKARKLGMVPTDPFADTTPKELYRTVKTHGCLGVLGDAKIRILHGAIMPAPYFLYVLNDPEGSRYKK